MSTGPQHHPPPTGARSGLTLLELMLVLALLVAIAGLAAPALRGAFSGRHLKLAAEHVRAVWARARNQAILQGRTWEFSYQPGTGNYRFGPRQVDEPAPAAAGSQTPAATAQSPVSGDRSKQLPGEIRFAAPSAFEGMVRSVDPTAQQTEVQADANEERAERDASWTEPILFYPDGTTSQAQLKLTGRGGRATAVQLRALTGQSELIEDAELTP